MGNLSCQAFQGAQQYFELERSVARWALTGERWGRLAARLQAKAAEEARGEAARQYKEASGRRRRGDKAGAEGGRDPSDDWVPVLDVFSTKGLSESEEALMRRVIAARVAPSGPRISYTQRPL